MTFCHFVLISFRSYDGILTPGVGAGFQIRPSAFVQFRSIALNPAIDRRVVNVQPAFEHHFLEIAVAEQIPKVPTHAEHNDLGFEMAPFERGGSVLEAGSSRSRE